MNYCGNCGVCCKVYPIPGFKEGGVWCQHFKPGKGCLIHEGDRPPVCAMYTCAWMALRRDFDTAGAGYPPGLDKCRPDRLKMLFWCADAAGEFEDASLGEIVLAGVELVPGARFDRMVKKFMAILLEEQSHIKRWLIHHFESRLVSWQRVRE